MAGEAESKGLGEWLRHGLQLALAALVACAGGGLILVLLLAAVIIVTAALPGGAGANEAAAVPPIVFLLFLLATLAIVQSVVACWLPAFVAGAILRSAGRSRGWARRRGAWATAGAVVAAIAWLGAFAPGAAQLDRTGIPAPVFAAAVLVAGAGAGQVYRSAMGTIGSFLGFDEEEETP